MTDEQHKPSSGQSKAKLNWIDEWSAKGWGWHMVPLEAGTPRPVDKNWTGRIYTAKELEQARDAGMNLGIATGRRGQHDYTLVAFDIEDTDLAPVILQTLRDRFPSLALRFRRKPGGGFVKSSGCFVKVRDEIEGTAPLIKKMVIGKQANGRAYVEILAEGQQFHVGGPRTDPKHQGVAPEWRPGVPDFDGGVLELELGEFGDLVSSLEDALRGQGVSVPGTAGTAQRATSATPARSFQVNNNSPDLEPLSEISKLVALVPNDQRFADRQDWVNMAHRIYAAAGGDPGAEEIWLEWCRQQPQNPGEPERVWGSLVNVTNKPTGLRLFVKEHYRQAYNAMLFDVPPEIDPDPLNPRTGKARYFAREVMREALVDDAGMATTSVTLSPFDYLDNVGRMTRAKEIIPFFAVEGIPALVVAAPGVGKSLLGNMLGWAAVLGIDPRSGKDIDPSHAFVLMGEDGEAEVGARALANLENLFKIQRGDKARITKHGTKLEVVAGRHLPLVGIDPKSGGMLQTIMGGLSHVSEFCEDIIAARDGRPIVFVFDMLSSIYAGDNNRRVDVDAVTRVIKALIAVLKRHGVPCAVFVTHHQTIASARAGTSDAFSAAGSIGLIGNFRAVFNIRASGTGERFLEIKRTKSNQGRVGETEIYEKMIVPSPLGGDTVWLRPATTADMSGTTAFIHQSIVVQAHAKWVRDGRPAIHAGTRPAKGFTHIGDFLKDLPEGASLSPGEVDQIVETGTRLGAWKPGRVRLGHGGEGGSSKAAIVFDENWVAPEEDAGGEDYT